MTHNRHQRHNPLGADQVAGIPVGVGTVVVGTNLAPDLVVAAVRKVLRLVG